MAANSAESREEPPPTQTGMDAAGAGAAWCSCGRAGGSRPPTAAASPPAAGPRAPPARRTSGGTGRILPEGVEDVLVEVAAAQHQLDPATRQQVERGVVLRDLHGVVVGAQGDRRADPQRGRALGDGGQEDRRRRDDVVAEVVLADRAAPEARRLRRDRTVDDHAVPLGLGQVASGDGIGQQIAHRGPTDLHAAGLARRSRRLSTASGTESQRRGALDGISGAGAVGGGAGRHGPQPVAQRRRGVLLQAVGQPARRTGQGEQCLPGVGREAGGRDQRRQREVDVRGDGSPSSDRHLHRGGQVEDLGITAARPGGRQEQRGPGVAVGVLGVTEAGNDAQLPQLLRDGPFGAGRLARRPQQPTHPRRGRPVQRTGDGGQAGQHDLVRIGPGRGCDPGRQRRGRQLVVGEDDECGLDGVDPAGRHAQRVGDLAGHGGRRGRPAVQLQPVGEATASRRAPPAGSGRWRPPPGAGGRRAAGRPRPPRRWRRGGGRRGARTQARGPARCGSPRAPRGWPSSGGGLEGRSPVHSSSATDSKEVAGTLAPPPTRSSTSWPR